MHNMLRREGDVWTVAFEGTSVLIKDSRGLQDIARLLARPGPASKCMSAISYVPQHHAQPSGRKLRTCESQATLVRCWMSRRDGRIASN